MTNTETMKQLSTLLGLATLLLITGCATADKIVTDTTPREPTTAVDVYKDGKIPDRKYKEIAELSFLGPREEELRAQRRFIRQAQKLGGNGVLFTVVPAGQKGGLTIFQNTAFVFKGNVIVYE